MTGQAQDSLQPDSVRLMALVLTLLGSVVMAQRTHPCMAQQEIGVVGRLNSQLEGQVEETVGAGYTNEFTPE